MVNVRAKTSTKNHVNSINITGNYIIKTITLTESFKLSNGVNSAVLKSFLPLAKWNVFGELDSITGDDDISLVEGAKTHALP